MKKQKLQKRQAHQVVASRLEGVVKNEGIKNEKKKPKNEVNG